MLRTIKAWRRQRYPLASAVFEVTSRCNLRCRYCYNIWKRPGGGPPFEASYARTKKTLKRLFRDADIKHVTFTGGEPFLVERFAETILFCRMRGKSVTIISNGTVATREDLVIMGELGVAMIEIPLHSSRPERHDWMTGVEGSWSRSRRALETTAQLGVEPVAVIVLTQANADGVADTLRLLEHMGIRRVMLNRFNIGGQGISESNHLALSVDQLKRAFRAANEVVAECRLEATSNVATPICLVDPRDHRAIHFTECGGKPERMPMTINAAGDVRICNHSPVSLGNIFKSTLEEMFSSEYVREWSEVVPQPCVACAEVERCRGGCRAACEQVGDPLAQVDPLFRGQLSRPATCEHILKKPVRSSGSA